MEYIKSNLRWPGGKSKMLDILDMYMPKRVDKYFDVFVGGGSVLLYVIQKYNPSVIYANDIDTNLINYYNDVKDNCEKLVDELYDVKNKYDANAFREKFKELDRSTSSGFFIANKTSFSGLNNNYSKLAYDRNFSMSAIKKLKPISNAIGNVGFINSDFACLGDKVQDIDGFFIYLDPPYYYNMASGLYGKRGSFHKNFDHDKLAEWVSEHSVDNRIMMSYDDSPYIRELYKNYNIYDFGFVYSMTNSGGNKCRKGKEIVITNYEVKTLF